MTERNLKTVSAEEFRRIAKDVLPHMEAIRETIAQELGADCSSWITINASGYMTFEPYGCPWKLVSGKDGASIMYEYSEKLELEA